MAELAPIYAPWDDNAEAMAAEIGELGVTVRQWRNRGNIPVRYWPKIIRASEARGKPITNDDLAKAMSGEGSAEVTDQEAA